MSGCGLGVGGRFKEVAGGRFFSYYWSLGCGGKPARLKQNRMRFDSDFSELAARVRRFIEVFPTGTSGGFDRLALELFALQFRHNGPYRRFCEARGGLPERVRHWTEIPAMPASGFKELELSCLPAAERTAVFHSSGTTAQRSSRHFHNAESLAIYEASLWAWFDGHFQAGAGIGHWAVLTPPAAQAPHSSLVHMFETIRGRVGFEETAFVATADLSGGWTLDLARTAWIIHEAVETGKPLALLGTAFSFVQLLDDLAECELEFRLPPGSRVLETGGYKGRSRALPKAELHGLITKRLGIPSSHIVCEYGMSELSSQAYDLTIARNPKCECAGMPGSNDRVRRFRFPPWARVQIASAETGLEASEGEAGLIRVFDLANVYSVMAIQAEDLAVRRGDGFELLGRAALAEPRGCSLMVAG